VGLSGGNELFQAINIIDFNDLGQDLRCSDFDRKFLSTVPFKERRHSEGVTSPTVRFKVFEAGKKFNPQIYGRRELAKKTMEFVKSPFSFVEVSPGMTS
jgi:hypothetical protein